MSKPSGALTFETLKTMSSAAQIGSYQALAGYVSTMRKKLAAGEELPVKGVVALLDDYYSLSIWMMAQGVSVEDLRFLIAAGKAEVA